MITVLLTTENSDDLEIRVPGGSRSLKVTLVNFTCVISYQSLIVTEAVFCTVYESFRQVQNRSILLTVLCLTSPPPMKGFPWYDLRKILYGGQRIFFSVHDCD